MTALAGWRHNDTQHRWEFTDSRGRVVAWLACELVLQMSAEVRAEHWLPVALPLGVSCPPKPETQAGD